MCETCDTAPARWLTPAAQRPVPERSGEAATYSPEYLARREGNAIGARPESWRSNIPA